MKHDKQCADYAQKGPGTKYKPTNSPGVLRGKIPSKTVSTSPNSDKRGKQGE